MITIFTTNAINIYAGINGLEVGQSIIILLSMLLHNIIELIRNPMNNQHYVSILFLIPCIACSFGLFEHNKFPAKVFVGDCFCYFIGMTMSVSAILGIYTKTMMLFFIPQLINFTISLPQILGVFPCPRHRLPKYQTETGKLKHIKTNHTLINLWL